MYPPHDKNHGPFPTRTVEEIVDDVVSILTIGARGTQTECNRAKRLLTGFSQHTPVWSAGDAHQLVGLLSACFQSLQGAASPFASYLEAPEVIVTLYRAHGQSLREAAEDLRTRTPAHLRDVTEQLIANMSWTSLKAIGLAETIDRQHEANDPVENP